MHQLDSPLMLVSPFPANLRLLDKDQEVDERHRSQLKWEQLQLFEP